MTDSEFARRTEPFRRELLAHCYRMIGSVDDAEDLVQETYLRAWRAYEDFQGRSSVRTWLYKIATNVCHSALQHRSRRVLPSGLGGPSDDPTAPVTGSDPAVHWLQPIPDALVSPESSDPAEIVASRHGLRLALIATLQNLPARQRAVLVLRDVLSLPAAEVAEVLGTTAAAVKSTLQRARAGLDQVATSIDQAIEPTEPEARDLLDQYIAAIENADGDALQRILHADATLEVVPGGAWFAGRATCVPFLVEQVLGSPGDWRAVPTRANGQPAAVGYQLGEDGIHRAFGIVALTTTTEGISRIVAFGDPGLAELFGKPALLR